MPEHCQQVLVYCPRGYDGNFLEVRYWDKKESSTGYDGEGLPYALHYGHMELDAAHEATHWAELPEKP